MKPLSIRQPWAWLICHGYKDVENRGWKIRHRGKIWIHAPKTCTVLDYHEAAAFALPLLPPGVIIPPLASLPRGGIVGDAEIVDCVHESQSPWFVGPYAAVLRYPRPIRLFPLRGQLGFFEVPFFCPIEKAREGQP